MTIYAANVMDIAKPINQKIKKGKKSELPVTPPPSPELTATITKKQPTEKQLIARANFAANRKLKIEEKARVIKEKIEEETRVIKDAADKATAIALKKTAQAEKRKINKATAAAAVLEETTTFSEEVDNAINEKPSKRKLTTTNSNIKKQKIDASTETDPPAWFQKFVQGAKIEESKIVGNDKKGLKQIKSESKVEAVNHWNDGLTRNRVENEVDGHMSRLYGMIFDRK